jgi:hypothetical protein
MEIGVLFFLLSLLLEFMGILSDVRGLLAFGCFDGPRDFGFGCFLFIVWFSVLCLLVNVYVLRVYLSWWHAIRGGCVGRMGLQCMIYPYKKCLS